MMMDLSEINKILKKPDVLTYERIFSSDENLFFNALKKGATDLKQLKTEIKPLDRDLQINQQVNKKLINFIHIIINIILDINFEKTDDVFIQDELMASVKRFYSIDKNKCYCMFTETNDTENISLQQGYPKDFMFTEEQIYDYILNAFSHDEHKEHDASTIIIDNALIEDMLLRSAEVYQLKLEVIKKTFRSTAYLHPQQIHSFPMINFENQSLQEDNEIEEKNDEWENFITSMSNAFVAAKSLLNNETALNDYSIRYSILDNEGNLAFFNDLGGKSLSALAAIGMAILLNEQLTELEK